MTDNDPETELAPTVSAPEAELAWSAGEDETELLDEDGDRERTTAVAVRRGAGRRGGERRGGAVVRAHRSQASGYRPERTAGCVESR